MKYPKIQTFYLRDPDTNYKTLLEGQFSMPEFAYLANNEWVFDEKIDGSNIRILYDGARNYIVYGGRTDRAQLPSQLIQNMDESGYSDVSRYRDVFGQASATLFGEGYGAGIQKGGNYRADQAFVLFDIFVGGFWLQREDLEDVARKMGFDIVPIIGSGSLFDMYEKTMRGFPSFWNEKVIAEGIVARPKCEMLSRNGERIITKLKHKDFLWQK